MLRSLVLNLEVACPSSSSAVVNRFEQSVIDYLSIRSDPVTPLLDDKEWSFSRAAGSAIYALERRQPWAPRGLPLQPLTGAGEIVSKVQADKGVTQTTQGILHERAYAAIADGNLRGAACVLEEALMETPKDILALRLAHDTYIQLGDRFNLLKSVERVLPYWRGHDYCYAWVMGMHAFALQENARPEQALEQAGRAMEIHDLEVWAGAACVGAYKQQAMGREGVRFIRETRGLNEDSRMWGHLLSQRALMVLDTGELTHAAGSIEEAVLNFDLCETQSNMVGWALCGGLTAGAMTDDRQPEAFTWEKWNWKTDGISDTMSKPFDYVTTAMACAAKSDTTKFNEVRDWMVKSGDHADSFCTAENPTVLAGDHGLGDEGGVWGGMSGVRGWSGANAREIGIPVIDAIAAFKRGDHNECTRTLLRVRRAMPEALGLSVVEEGIMEDTLLLSAMRGGEALRPVARGLLNERVGMLVRSPRCWVLSAALRTMDGDFDGASADLRRASELGWVGQMDLL